MLEPLHHDAPRNASLYGALNRTVTPMGARRLRDWLSQPLAAVAPILRRQKRGAATCVDASRRPGRICGPNSREVRDLERTIGRLSAGTGNARDLVALRQALEQLPGLKALARRISMRPGTARNGATTCSWPSRRPAGEPAPCVPARNWRGRSPKCRTSST